MVSRLFLARSAFSPQLAVPGRALCAHAARSCVPARWRSVPEAAPPHGVVLPALSLSRCVLGSCSFFRQSQQPSSHGARVTPCFLSLSHSSSPSAAALPVLLQPRPCPCFPAVGALLVVLPPVGCVQPLPFLSSIARVRFSARHGVSSFLVESVARPVSYSSACPLGSFGFKILILSSTSLQFSSSVVLVVVPYYAY